MSSKVQLTEEERGALAKAKATSPNRHWIEVAVESIVAARIAEALKYAADGCVNEADRAWVHKNADEYDRSDT